MARFCFVLTEVNQDLLDIYHDFDNVNAMPDDHVISLMIPDVQQGIEGAS
jgi:hypothetical protein